MKLLLTFLGILFLTACTVPQEQVAVPVGSSDTQAVLYPAFLASGATPVGPTYDDRLFITNANGSQPFRIAIYGTNSSGAGLNESVIVNSTNLNVSVHRFTTIYQVKLNQSLVNAVTVYENASRSSLFTISAGTTEGYNTIRADGGLPDYLVAQCTNSSNISVKQFTEFGIYTKCGDVVTPLNITPMVSPNGVDWFAQTKIACDNNQSYTGMDLEGVQVMRFEVCSYDNTTASLLVGLGAK